jgi:hypothetical protein
VSGFGAAVSVHCTGGRSAAIRQVSAQTARKTDAGNILQSRPTLAVRRFAATMRTKGPRGCKAVAAATSKAVNCDF